MDSSVAVAPAPKVGLAQAQKLKLPGGAVPIYNIKDPHVQEMGRFAVMEQPKLLGGSMEFIRVVSGDVQEVAGKLYRLVVEVKKVVLTETMPSYIQCYLATVLEKQGSWELLAFVPVPPALP